MPKAAKKVTTPKKAAALKPPAVKRVVVIVAKDPKAADTLCQRINDWLHQAGADIQAFFH
jgi:acyl transferase domain-containing protein